MGSHDELWNMEGMEEGRNCHGHDDGFYYDLSSTRCKDPGC